MQLGVTPHYNALWIQGRRSNWRQAQRIASGLDELRLYMQSRYESSLISHKYNCKYNLVNTKMLALYHSSHYIITTNRTQTEYERCGG